MNRLSREQIIREVIKKWQPVLGLSHWMINIRIKTCSYLGDRTIQADICDDQKYLEADITIYRSFWEDDEEKQEKTIVHELCHLLLCRLHPHLSPSGDDALEETVQRIAMLFFYKS